MDDHGLVKLTLDPVRYPAAVDAIVPALGTVLPGFGVIAGAQIKVLRSSRNEWLILVRGQETAPLIDQLQQQLQAFPAIISDASDGYVLAGPLGLDRLLELSGVGLAADEARPVTIRQVTGMAFRERDQAVVILSRSYHGIPGENFPSIMASVYQRANV